MKRFGVLIVLSFLAGCSLIPVKSYEWTENQLIAHATGGIADKNYTNSLDAFYYNYEKGHRLFEIDISITSDDELVARHGWEDDLGQNLNGDKQPLSYKEFMDIRYYEKYKPMDFQDVLSLLKKHKDIYVVLDGKVSSHEDVKRLYEMIDKETKDLDPLLKSRLIPQMFYKEDLEVIRNYGFSDVVYVVGREEYTPDSLAKYCSDNDIKVVSLSRKRTSQELVHALSKKDILIYMYTLNEIDEMKKYLSIGVHGFFTDFVGDLN